jgi:SAM-dependent methyltransferase
MVAGDNTSDAEPAGPRVMIDTSKASIARVYDACLDGKDNYEIDRKVLNDVLRFAPIKLLAKANRRWLVRATRYLATMGVDQFLDCGSGLPTMENTHEVAQRYNPEAIVIYVDIDPLVSAHGRALLVENDRTHFVEADLTRPRELLAHPTVTKHIDFNRPIALFQISTLHHVDDELQPPQIMAEYIDALPSGSFVGLMHLWDPDDGSEASQLARRIETSLLNSAMATGRFRTRAEIQAMLAGLELLEPGLVELDQWWPEGPAPTPPTLVERLMLAAVGRKP